MIFGLLLASAQVGPPLLSSFWEAHGECLSKLLGTQSSPTAPSPRYQKLCWCSLLMRQIKENKEEPILYLVAVHSKGPLPLTAVKHCLRKGDIPSV